MKPFSPSPPSPLVAALEQIVHERLRQIQDEGYTPENDDQWTFGELASAAASYALDPQDEARLTDPPATWPFKPDTWKPGERRRELIKAGALILAELERINRLEASKPSPAEVPPGWIGTRAQPPTATDADPGGYVESIRRSGTISRVKWYTVVKFPRSWRAWRRIEDDEA